MVTTTPTIETAHVALVEAPTAQATVTATPQATTSLADDTPNTLEPTPPSNAPPAAPAAVALARFWPRDARTEKGRAESG